MMESRCCLDIETVRNERAGDWYADVKVSAPANYKDPDKIEAKVKELRGKLEEKAALTWHTGRVISYAVCGVKTDGAVFEWDLDEAVLLRKLAETIGTREVYTKSGKLFDFPFLVGRYMANKIEVPTFLRQRSLQFDIDEFFSYSSANQQRMSLDAYAHGIGMSGKAGNYKLADALYYAAISGEDTKEIEKELEEYNIQDVNIVREIVRRYTGVL